MTQLVLYGSVTSPFVRRVRVVAAELGVSVTMVDTATPEGRARLLAVSPIAKVPAAEYDGQVLFDSANILDVLTARGPRDVLRPLPTSALERARELNVVHAIDEVTLSAIRLFYLERDGVETKGTFLEAEQARVGALLAYLEAQVDGGRCTHAPGFGRPELALVTSLEWLAFRKRVDLSGYPKLRGFLEAHRDRPSLAATRPH